MKAKNTRAEGLVHGTLCFAGSFSPACASNIRPFVRNKQTNTTRAAINCFACITGNEWNR